jgi:trigger factor
LTVNVAEDTFAKAKQDAAKRISAQVNIPGFRKGKAPYNLIVRYVGEAIVEEEAIEGLSQQIYRSALDEVHVDPFLPGQIEKYETKPEVVIKFLVHKQPEVELGAYRDVRVAYEPPQVEDQAVTDTIQRMLETRAVIETVEREAQIGDKVKMTVYGDAFHEHGAEDAHEADEAEGVTPAADAAPAVEASVEGQATTGEAVIEDAHADHDHADDDHDHDHSEVDIEEFIDEEIDDILSEAPNEDLVPGFSAQIVGMKAGDEKTFRIRLPKDFRDTLYADHDVEFRVKMLEVRSRTLPALDDEFAKTASDGEVDNLSDFQTTVRKNMQESANRRYDAEYSDKVLDAMVTGAACRYPEPMVQQTIDDILQSLDRNLRNSGLNLDYYMQVQRKTVDELRNDYRETALKRVQRSLVMGEIARVEAVNITREDIIARIEATANAFGDQQDSFRTYMMRPENQQNVALDLLTEGTQKRIIAIGKGENPPIQDAAVAEVEANVGEAAPNTAGTEPSSEAAAEPKSE